jgi:cell fate regulator YaaT (PSP1 superfamily)
MSEEGSRKDASYLPRSWGPHACCSGKSVKSRSADPGASCSEPDLIRKEASASLEEPTSPLSGELQGSQSSNTPEKSDQERENTKPRISLTVCGVRFGYAGRIYHFDATDIELLQGDWVIVKTEKGVGLGHIAIPPYVREMDLSQFEGLRKVLRKAGRIDFNQKERCVQKEKEAYDFCLDKITELALPMKLVAVECFFDTSKYVFYFTAEGRVDFRELVKELVSRFPVRIEMRQIGVRHEAKMIGGLACCGQELCCSRFLTDFRPVSVKMAKNQNLSLNPSKISGACGRLMCCLGYEHNTYEEFKKGLPKIGRSVRTAKGEGVVLKHNPLAETVFIRLSEESIVEVTRDDVLAELELSTRMPIEIIEESDQVTEGILDHDEPEEV